MTNSYGYCPLCGAPTVEHDRRPGGNNICANGHSYPAADAVLEPIAADLGPGKMGVEMRVLEVVQPHTLGRTVALTRLGALAATSKTNESIKVESVDLIADGLALALTVYGVGVRARLMIRDAVVTFTTDPLPWLAVPFIGYAQQQIQKKLAEALQL